MKPLHRMSASGLITDLGLGHLKSSGVVDLAQVQQCSQQAPLWHCPALGRG